jgi:hypothetical protein
LVVEGRAGRHDVRRDGEPRLQLRDHFLRQRAAEQFHPDQAGDAGERAFVSSSDIAGNRRLPQAGTPAERKGVRHVTGMKAGRAAA